jgi:hypothetical protein
LYFDPRTSGAVGVNIQHPAAKTIALSKSRSRAITTTISSCCSRQPAQVRKAWAGTSDQRTRLKGHAPGRYFSTRSDTIAPTVTRTGPQVQSNAVCDWGISRTAELVFVSEYGVRSHNAVVRKRDSAVISFQPHALVCRHCGCQWHLHFLIPMRISPL